MSILPGAFLRAAVFIGATTATALAANATTATPEPLIQPVSSMAWLVGNWDCSPAAGSPDKGHVVHNHVTLGADRLTFVSASTIDSGKTPTHDILGYNTAQQQWYEHTIDTPSRQEFVSESTGLTSNSLSLIGFIKYQQSFIHVHTKYTWSNTDAYRFEATALSSGGWQPIEIHDCKRKR